MDFPPQSCSDPRTQEDDGVPLPPLRLADLWIGPLKRDEEHRQQQSRAYSE
ncbi:MAG TPA: hypothetical protein VFF76_01260 [Holophagaceae bacterium]|nr:hypothetical protein [Holophagaceae bacterium]